MEHVSFDVLVLGSGAAGLRAAISAREAGLSVCVLSKGSPGKSTCTGFSGGVMAGSSGVDRRDLHLQRTLTAGRGLNDRRLAEILVEEAPARLRELVDWGIRGVLREGYLYASGRPPVLGGEIIRCLLEKNETLGTVFLGNWTTSDLVSRDGASGVCACGRRPGERLLVTARATVVAAGGAGAIYQRNDNPGRILGDGYRLLLEAGATLRDMEFVQFYPLCLAEPEMPSLVIPPKLADRGRLVNMDGEDILEKFAIEERPAGERARDRLSQALFREIYRNGREVLLDFRDLSEADWQVDPFAATIGKLLANRYGARSRPLRVAPAAHHTMGGAAIDGSGATTVPGVFAAGESSGGLHGANRMGGNALSETLVFGARAGAAAAAWAAGLDRPGETSLPEMLRERLHRWSKGSLDGAALKDRLRPIMWEDGGIVRDGHGLSRALNAVRDMEAEAAGASSTPDGKSLVDLIEFRSAAMAAVLILEGALCREESRGAHFREDFPNRDDANWQGHLEFRLSPGGGHLRHFVPEAC